MFTKGILSLIAAYIFSQFFRAFLAVLTDVLERDLGASAADLANASGLWFLTFALMQLPVGWALDHLGPRRTCAVLFAAGAGGGALVFAYAQVPWHLSVAMGLIGVGCAPVLMGSYFIFARTAPAARFATLGAIVIGIGSLGNLASAAPTTLAVAAIGWRATVLVLGAACLMTAAAIWVFVKDPGRVDTAERGSILDLLRLPALWLMFPLILANYAPAAGLRGLWAGPYLREVFGAGDGLVGVATLVIGLAMVVATFVYGPLDRWLGTRKWVVFWGNFIGMAGCGALWLGVDHGIWTAVGLMALIAAAGMSYPVIMAHGRASIPQHLMGRGVTLLNLCSIAGVGVAQVVTGRLYDTGGGGAESYRAILGYYAVTLALGLVIYLWARDRMD